MPWLTSTGEFIGGFTASFLERRARTKSRLSRSTIEDGNRAAYDVLNKGLRECTPMNDHVTRKGLKELCRALKSDDSSGALIAIEANPGPRKRDLCLALLKLSVIYICSENPSDLIRAATYTIIDCK